VDSILRVSVISFLQCRMLVLGGLCAVLALPSFGGNAGDIVTGVIVSEDKQVLVLRKDPCDPDSTTVAFSSPWKKRKLNTKTCPDKSVHEVYEVEQLQTPDDKQDDKKDEAKAKAKESDGDRPKEATPKPATGDNSQQPPDSR